MSGKRIDNAFLLLLYPQECEPHKKALDMLEKGLISSQWEYYYIEHNKDLDENGELKKPHTHVVLFTSRKMAKNTLANILQITENYTSYTNDVVDDLLYLTHKCPKGVGKYQYDDNEVKTNSKVDYITRSSSEQIRYMNDEDRLQVLEEIFDEVAETSVEYVNTRFIVKLARLRGIGQYAVRNHQYIDKALLDVNQIIGKRLERKRFEPLSDDDINPFNEEE